MPRQPGGQRPDLADLLEPVRDAFDRLIADLRAYGSAVPPREYDRLEEKFWSDVALGGRAAFRGRRT